MGNSSISLHAMMDSIATVGDLKTALDSTGGWAAEPALTIGNDVMSELISERFPWKWNQLRIPPFPLTSLQQDYATEVTDIGWLQYGVRVDINNTTFPPPTWPIYAVRDLPYSNVQSGWPYHFSWHYNRDLEYRDWPGPQTEYTQPIGATIAPDNPASNIIDDAGNIYVLKTFGITGDTPPVAPPWPGPGPQPPNWPVGAYVNDGTCVWKIVSPDAQGFRFFPIPPTAGQVWLMRLYAQRRAPIFTVLNQLLNPIPDDQAKWFRDGCIAYAHRYTTNPAVSAKFESKKMQWIAAMEAETRQNDREDENKGFFPDKSIMSPSYTTDPGPYPYRYGWRS